MADTAAVTLPKPGTYTLDPAHTELGFVARHLVGTKVRGRFTEFTGQITIADPPEASRVEAEAKAASIETGQQKRDDHLRTNDFLDVPNHPTVTLVSTGVTRVDDEQWTVEADLTIRGVTKPVVLDVEYHGFGPGLGAGQEVVAFSATTDIDRRDFGVSFNGTLEAGGLVVGNRVRIELEAEAVRQPDA